jgi:hypothetical protein
MIKGKAANTGTKVEARIDREQSLPVFSFLN